MTSTHDIPNLRRLRCMSAAIAFVVGACID